MARRTRQALSLLAAAIACARGPGPPDWGTKDIPDWGPPEKSPVVGQCYRFPVTFFGAGASRDVPGIVSFGLDTLHAPDRTPRTPDGTVQIYVFDSSSRARQLPRMRGGWWNRGQDSVDVSWSSGFAWTTVELRIDGDSLRGGASLRDDNGGHESRNVVARRVDCPLPP